MLLIALLGAPIAWNVHERVALVFVRQAHVLHALNCVNFSKKLTALTQKRSLESVRGGDSLAAATLAEAVGLPGTCATPQNAL